MWKANSRYKSKIKFFSKDFLSEKAVYELNKIKEIEQKISRDDLIYKTGNKKKVKKYDFEKFKIISFFWKRN